MMEFTKTSSQSKTIQCNTLVFNVYIHDMLSIELSITHLYCNSELFVKRVDLQPPLALIKYKYMY